MRFTTKNCVQLAAATSIVLGATLALSVSAATPNLQQGGQARPTPLPVLGQPVTLTLSQSDAFAILGHSCGGIQVHPYVTGFDPVSGYPSGAVHLQTTCSLGGIGGNQITYTAWAGVTWDFSANVISSTALGTTPSVDPTFVDSDVYCDTIYNTATSAHLLVPGPGRPQAVSVVQSGDQFLVSWTPRGVNPAAVSSSVLTATPFNSSAPILSTTVVGTATNGAIPMLQPQTTYLVTVVNATLSGSGPTSNTVSVTTGPATIPPGVPPGVSALWTNPNPTGSTDTIIASWLTADPGDSPIDQYQVQITDQENGTVYTQTVSGSTLSASFVEDWNPDWDVIVRAHNAVGWGAWSNPITLGGL